MRRIGSERRVQRRVPWDGVAVACGSTGRVRGQGIDLSASGVALRCDEATRPGQTLSLRVVLDGTVISLQGVVVSSVAKGSSHRWGVRFTAAHRPCRRALEGFVQRRLAELPAPPVRIPPPPPIPKTIVVRPSQRTPTPRGVPRPVRRSQTDRALFNPEGALRASWDSFDAAIEALSVEGTVTHDPAPRPRPTHRPIRPTRPVGRSDPRRH